MVVNGQRITAFVNDCLCRIKAITQYVFKVCSQAGLIPDIEFLLYLIGMENQYNLNVFFYKLVSDFIPSSVQNG